MGNIMSKLSIEQERIEGLSEEKHEELKEVVEELYYAKPNLKNNVEKRKINIR